MRTRIVYGGLLAMLAILVAACGRQLPAPAAGTTAEVAAVPGRQRLQLGRLHRAERDRRVREGDRHQVNYDTYDSQEMLETKLLSGKSGYDVVVVSSDKLARLVPIGTFRKLDYTLLPTQARTSISRVVRTALRRRSTRATSTPSVTSGARPASATTPANCRNSRPRPPPTAGRLVLPSRRGRQGDGRLRRVGHRRPERSDRHGIDGGARPSKPE